jgi:hypothetical protein
MGILLLAGAGLLGMSLGATSLDLGLAVEARYRTTQTLPGGVPQRIFEGEVAPWITFGLTQLHLELGAEYRPTLTASDSGSGSALLLHQGRFLGRWQRDPGWLVSALVTGRFGNVNAFQLQQAAGPGGGPVQLAPTLTAIGYRSLEATLGLGARPGPRHRLLASLEAADEGGLTLADQRLLPLQRRLRAMFGLEWDAGPHDLLLSSLDVVVTQFSTGPTAGVATLEERWRRTISPALVAWVGAGPAAAGQNVGGVTSVKLRPAVQAGVEYDGRFGSLPVKAGLLLVAAPFVDRITAAVPERIGLAATLAITPALVWRVEGTASSGRVMEGVQQGDEAWAATAKVARSLGAFVELAVGARGFLQRQPRYGISSLDWHGFLALEVHARRGELVKPDPSAVKDPLRPRTPGGAEEHQ